jgi:hypothetical protein
MKRWPADLAARRALSRVDERIAAAVAEAPPLPDDLAARLAELIRATSAAERTGAAA